MGLLKTIKKGVKSIGNAVGDVFEGAGDFVSDAVEDVGDFVEDAWDNDIVKAAALAAGAYYAYPLVAGSSVSVGASATASGALSTASTWASNAWTGLVDKAYLAGYSPNALGVAGYAVSGVGKALVTANTAGGMLGVGAQGGQGGTGGPKMPSMARANAVNSPSTQYGSFKASVTNLGMDPRVADAMAKVAQTNIPSIRGAMNQVGRVAASGPNINVGSTSIGVRETTRAV